MSWCCVLVHVLGRVYSLTVSVYIQHVHCIGCSLSIQWLLHCQYYDEHASIVFLLHVYKLTFELPSDVAFWKKTLPNIILFVLMKHTRFTWEKHRVHECNLILHVDQRCVQPVCKCVCMFVCCLWVCVCVCGVPMCTVMCKLPLLLRVLIMGTYICVYMYILCMYMYYTWLWRYVHVFSVMIILISLSLLFLSGE